jgi:peptide/nickel transport system permease protein
MRWVRRITRGMSRRGKLTVGVGLILVLVLIAAFHNLIDYHIGGGQNPLALGYAQRWLPPGGHYRFGTDEYGRDILALSVTGLVNSLVIGAIAGVISTVIGVIVAFVAGYKGGVIDGVLNTVTDAFLVIPTLPLLLAFSEYAKHVGIVELSIILSVFAWAFAARVIRSQVLTLRTRAYVDLAKVTMSRDDEIIIGELLPNLLPFIGVGFANAVLGAIFSLVGLEVIGLGPSGVIDLGFLINEAVDNGALTLGIWPLFVIPIILLTVLFFGLNLINIGLDETYNPRLRSVTGG